MKKKWLFWLMLAAAIAPLPLAAQIPPAPADSAFFSPLVSRIQGELRNNLVRLSWMDSADARGTVYIFRSTRPFERSASLAGMPRIEVPHGTQFYVDEVERGEIDRAVYYFVVASNETGQTFEVPISHVNMIRVEIPAAAPIPFTPMMPPLPIMEDPVPPVPAGISSLQATADGDRVLITFTHVPAGPGAVLYRSASPIRQTSDLLGAAIVQMGVTSPFIDRPVPGIPYYYAVILEEDLIRGTVYIILGQNATTAAAEIADPQALMRPMPLPQLSAQGAPSGFFPPQALSPEAARALEALPAQPAPAPAAMIPRVFARDLAAPHAGGEDLALFSIVNGSFAARNWDAARNELVDFLSLPRTPDAQARARFYLGQSYYFMGRPREALFEFLAIQELYPAEAMAWIQASLHLLAAQ
ncbi:MAG: hypothetical protein FWC65_00715 [Treponema sp.]|nr:hypothetical protein [Treponema sp.]